MFDTTLRNAKDRIAEPLARQMSNVSPNTVTVTAVVIGLGSATFAAFGQYWWGLVFWLLNRALDGLDGLLARLHSKQDDFGGYLDILLDFVAYAALPIGLVIGDPSQERYLALAVMLAIFYVNTASWMYLAAILEKRYAHDPETATSIVMPNGVVGGFETIVAYCLFLLFPAALTTLYIMYSTLLLITIFQRLIWAKRALA